MGLYVSHSCFHGTYQAFNRWRKAVAACVGVKLDEMEGFGGDITWPPNSCLLAPPPRTN